MLPTHPGSVAFVEYDDQDQNRNWHGSSAASADNNDDKRIHSRFFTLGYQHLFNRSWGVMAELPYTSRYFKRRTRRPRWFRISPIRRWGIFV